MKYLTERTEIAKAINGREVPVVTMDLSDVDEYGLKSEPVVIDNGIFRDGFPYMIHSEIRVYTDEKRFTFSSGGACIHNEFGYSDVVEMLKYRNAPVIKKDSDVIVVVKDSVKRECYIIKLHTGKRIDPFCSTPLHFEDDTDILVPLLLKKAEEHLVARGEKYLRALDA